MALMQPKPSEVIPKGKEWVYEVKYDGFRAILNWKPDDIRLISRNGKDLSANFPEIITFCKENQHKIKSFLPLQLDGEIVILNTEIQANFPLLQQRGRFKTAEKIQHAAKDRPAHFLCFDLLQIASKTLTKESFDSRKEKLKTTLEQLELSYPVDWHKRIGYVESFTSPKQVWSMLEEQLGEGLIAKKVNSRYIEGKSHSDWFKIKNWRTISGFITGFDQENGYFELSVFHDDSPTSVGKFKHGLDGEELTTIKTLIRNNGTKSGNVFTMPPAICVDVNCLDIDSSELREPQFKQFRFDLKPEDCTYNKVKEAISMFPKTIEFTKHDKVFWNNAQVSKGDLLIYLRQIAPYMVPFVENKALTVIRCPDGMDGESFYQKHTPDYAPDYVAGIKSEGQTLLHCGSVEALTWFGNHGTIEYHVPFQYMGRKTPIEIVFDLDPPNMEAFELAVLAADLLKKLLDQLHVKAFIKTSGNKGLQVYIPIPEGSLSYEETALFTQALALLLEKKHPDQFTTERLKKNRNNRLYIDYVQHGKDKTLIAPYSPRRTEWATVSTPLFWDEVNEKLSPKAFTVHNVVDRVKEKGCPFASYEQARNSQNLELIKEFIQQASN